MREEKKVSTTDDALSASHSAYPLDRTAKKHARSLSSPMKQQFADKAARFKVPLPKVKGLSEEEVFNVVTSGKRKLKLLKRMITKTSVVGEGFTRQPAKYERFIDPMALRYKRAYITHPELGVTAHLPIIRLKRKSQTPFYTHIGVLSKGSVIEVKVSELVLTTATGKVVWGR